MTSYERRLKLLKTEVELDFPDLIPALEKGLRTVLITDSWLGEDLNRDELRRIGGMAMLCVHHYGAGVMFIKEDNVIELRRTPPKI